MDEEEAWWQLLKNAANNIEQVLEATAHKAAALWLPTIHHENYEVVLCLMIWEFLSLYIHIHIYFSCSRFISFFGTQLYDINYSYLIKIICILLNDFKNSYQILIFLNDYVFSITISSLIIIIL